MPGLKPITAGFFIGAVVIVVIAGVTLVNLKDGKPTHVVRINTANPLLEDAIKQARSGLDGFISELSKPKQGEGFAVKAAFKTLEGREYLWVRSPVFSSGSFTGVLDQQPMALPGKEKGDTVSFPKRDAVDWLIKDDHGTRGAYTEKALSSESGAPR